MQDVLDSLLNIDGAKADMEYWCKYNWLPIGQLTLLSFGLNPNIINSECVKSGRYDLFVSDYKERHNLIRQAPIVFRNKPSISFNPQKRFLAQDLSPEANLLDFIEWAIQIKLNIPLDMINTAKMLHKELDVDTRCLIDEDSEYYSEQLDIACLTQRMVINNRDNNKTFKEQAREYLNKNHSHLNKAAINRILVMVNPNSEKDGGRPKRN